MNHADFTPWILRKNPSPDAWDIFDGDESDPTLVAIVANTDNARLIVKAREMLAALELALIALNTIPRTQVNYADSYEIAAELDKVIAEVKGENDVQS